MIRLDDIQGHWQRRWIKAPRFEDSTTRVHWMQAGEIYADVRIPLDRPNISGAQCLADLPSDAVRQLSKAEGFAGTVVVEDSICTWARDINWHGETRDIDAGRLSFDVQGDLIEEGVHADYTELWTRPEEAPRKGVRLMAGDRVGYLVTVGTSFVFGLGYPDAAASAELETIADLFERVHMLGRWEGDRGTATLSTNPFQEGTVCLARTGSGLTYSHISFTGVSHEIEMEVVQ